MSQSSHSAVDWGRDQRPLLQSDSWHNDLSPIGATNTDGDNISREATLAILLEVVIVHTNGRLPCLRVVITDVESNDGEIAIQNLHREAARKHLAW